MSNTQHRKTTVCRCCGYELEGSTSQDSSLCDECEDSQSLIRAGKFHDQDLIARDNEERAWLW